MVSSSTGLFAQNNGKQTYSGGIKVFNSRFRVKVKEFVVSVTDSEFIKLSEWGSKVSDAICLGRYGAVWMMNMLDKLRMVDRMEDFVAKFKESSRAFLAQRCANKRGRFLMIAQYRERHRKGVVMVPEGANGEGWASISRVFQAVVNSLVSSDKAKRRIVVDKRRSGVTYADVTTNVGTSNNADQRELLCKERMETEGNDPNAKLRARI